MSEEIIERTPQEVHDNIVILLKEKQQYRQALLDIQNILATKQKAKGLTNQLLNIQEQSCLDIVNKVLGSDKNE